MEFNSVSFIMMTLTVVEFLSKAAHKKQTCRYVFVWHIGEL